VGGNNIYQKIRDVSKGREVYILHDGPPMQRNIHLGTALNKIIKDMVIKAKNMTGFDSIMCPAGTVTACPSSIRSTRSWVRRKMTCPGG